MSSQEANPYCRAARFPSERTAGAAYFRIQRLIDSPDAELSAYRLQLRGVCHVAVVGDAPGDGLTEELEKTFASGEPVDLPGEVLDFIWSRRAEQIQHGPWMEGHYRPGRQVQEGGSMPEQLFPLGRIVMTANLRDRLQEANPESWEAELQQMIRRHASGDWGDLDEEDKRENQLSLERGFRIFSAYTTASGIRVWVITEADRSCTTALLPADY